MEAAHPIPTSAMTDDMNYSDHGGTAVLSKLGLHLSKVDTKTQATKFEYLCCRVGDGFAPFLLVVIYRPGSKATSDQFYHEFSLLLESLATYQ